MPMRWTTDEIDAEVARHDPVHEDLSDVVRSEGASELLRRILDIDDRTASDRPGRTGARDGWALGTPWWPGFREKLSSLGRPVLRRPRLALAGAGLILAAALGGTFAASTGGGLASPFTTRWHAARALEVPRSTHTHAGTWRLLDTLVRGTWTQNPAGPPEGSLTCPTVHACYDMSGRYASAMAGAPLVSVSLYVSTDLGTSWSALPMPQGFSPTSGLSCASATTCAAGGTYDGQPVLVSTRNAGHSFTVAPLPAGTGALRSLSCPSATACAGLAATAAKGPTQTAPIDATFLETTDGGVTFQDLPIVSGDSMYAIVCTSSQYCTVVGTTDTSATSQRPVGASAVTTDGGRTWRAGTFPSGFGIQSGSTLVCADRLHCDAGGWIPITAQNPPGCRTLPGFPVTTGPITTTWMDPSVRAISTLESKLATQARRSGSALPTTRAGLTCTSTARSVTGDIASTSNGGLSWSAGPLPSDVARPWFSDLACPTATHCWAAGSQIAAQHVGTVVDADSSVLLGTQDGGRTWSKVTFGVPAGAPNATGQSFISMGPISCPTTSACVALGATAQGALSAPVYRLADPGN